MAANNASWPHQVAIQLTRADFREKLRDIEEWLQGWEIPYRVGSTLGEAGMLRVRFAEVKFARAFRFHHGGMLVPGDEVETAMLGDETDEVEFQRLADETGCKE